MKKIKLLIYAKSVDGGTGTFVESLQKLEKVQIKILITQKPQYRKTKSQNYEYCFSQEKYSERYLLLLLPFFLLKERFWLDNRINKYKPNVVITVDAHCLLVYSVFRKSSVKLLATIHNNLLAVVNYRIPQIFRRLISQLLQFYLNKADKVVCVSKGLANSLKVEFGLSQKPKVIYYGIKKAKKVSFRPKDKLSKPILLSVGRFCEQKDFLTIIKAFFLIKQKISESELWLVGDGPQKSKLLSYVKENKVADVKFLGWQQNLKSIYQKANIFIFSSNWEGLPWTILEAMTHDLPVIATNTFFGPSEIIERNKYGILIKKDHKEMSKQIISVLTNKSYLNSLSHQSSIRVKDFNLDLMCQCYLKLFQVL
jgi:glycosyltransferase involved in cell wall biosynthesis